MGTWKSDKSKFRILNLLYCIDRLNNDGLDYDNNDSEFGIDNEEDNLFDNDIYGCEIQKRFLGGNSSL